MKRIILILNFIPGDYIFSEHSDWFRHIKKELSIAGIKKSGKFINKKTNKSMEITIFPSRPAHPDRILIK